MFVNIKISKNNKIISFFDIVLYVALHLIAGCNTIDTKSA